ncbi:(5-formylfuran-3-yl)methyl phosphate synthase [Blastopirellula sp. JC732]|uniref:(5-formylfuran-3-yl)methyl phosphate synthase n=1 Tax=Blastopirellula sediminis TaxID=2894196 RepID=A0A9X1SMU3_9BACT|nr:(5-formylfuran-3-yl)methyl phosphate synthase [Blastopirellula sediminis]MCC9604648.1 (5-formylfuran-3-yl)methyl phosphate synthase [Blastopirellula sediminis]MCC9632054.1 (5-formylfuran-3-yl)methyl phosphate synthase [Blastopirellula sediminis]
MTQLLVSVRSAEEASAALAGGADLIDVKEPSLGSLGAADPQVWRDVIQMVRAQVPVSVALGEISDGERRFDADSFRGASMAKYGLANMADSAIWMSLAARAYEQVPRGCARVAVYYVDQSRAKCPPLHDVLRWSGQISATTILFDTLVKDGQTLFDFFTPSELTAAIATIHEAGMKVACGGSLTAEHFAAAISAGADILAVRGAACEGSRTSRVNRERVRDLKAKLNSFVGEGKVHYASNDKSRFA